MIILVLLVILGYTYFGGPKVPKILKDYKEMLLGVFVGILLHQFFGVGIENNIEGLVNNWNEPNGDIINFADYIPPSEADSMYGGYENFDSWAEAAIQNISERYENYNPQSDGGEVFGAIDGGTYANGGKKYTCGDGKGTNRQMVAVPIRDSNKVVQMCFKKDDPFNFTDTEAIRIRNPRHDSQDGSRWSQQRWQNKKIVSCEAASSRDSDNPTTQMLTTNEGDGTKSFYCK